LNTGIPASSPAFGVPYPGTLVLDPHGLVRVRAFEEAYQDRDTVATVLLELGEGPSGTATRMTTPHLDVSLRLTDEVVAAGTVFAAVIDVAPKPGIHVYAPGAKGYKAVALTIESRLGLRVRPLRFPASENYHFKPLDEYVPVYQRPFRLVQRMAVDASPAAQEALKGVERLVIRGSLNYQACDDTTCFSPVSLPVSWTVPLRPLDRLRFHP
jgi:DsbC/DsbD-like thiol-disulfide interchange protein